jgi:hypothetical protein
MGAKGCAVQTIIMATGELKVRSRAVIRDLKEVLILMRQSLYT